MRGWNVLPLLLAASLAVGGRGWAVSEPLSIPEPSPGERTYARGLLAALEDSDDEVVAWALLSLVANDSESGFLNESRFPGVRGRLVDFLRTPRAAQASRAREGLLHNALLITQANLGEGSADTARGLVELLGVERNPELRFVEERALGHLDEAAREQIPRLVEMLKLQGVDLVDISSSASRVLGSLGGAAREQVLRVLGTLLEDPVPWVRSRAADTLGTMGRDARPLRPRLRKLLRDPDSGVRLSAKSALERLRELPLESQVAKVAGARASRERADQALKARLEALKREHPEAFAATEQAELQQRESGVRAWTTLTVLRLKDPDPRVRAKALHLWVDMSERVPEFLGEEHTKRLIPLAAQLLEEPDGKLRAAGARALGRMGAREYASRLAGRLKDPDPDAQGFAVQALGKLGAREYASRLIPLVVGFVEPRFHGNILLATQRMEWTPPATASVYELQPLTEEQVREFLRGREPVLGEQAPLRGEAYREACEHFLSLALSPEQPEELRREMLEVLSNPMDLTVVAQMLAAGHAPDLFRLQEQQYELMARDYRENNLTEFPLKDFSEEAYQMRRDDRSVIPEERFGKELLRLEAHKLVVRREWKRPGGQEGREWHFRHDKLWDFFIAQTFLGQDNARIFEYQDEPRFRGVYFLLAKLLDPERALALQDYLVEHAAETSDHTVSDEFVIRLQARWRELQVRPPAGAAPDSSAAAT